MFLYQSYYLSVTVKVAVPDSNSTIKDIFALYVMVPEFEELKLIEPTKVETSELRVNDAW